MKIFYDLLLVLFCTAGQYQRHVLHSCQLRAEPVFLKHCCHPANALILGCTHYPLLKTMIGEFMGQSVTLVDPAKTAAHHLEQMLSERGLRAAQEHEGQAHFYVSDVPDSFVQTADLFLGEYKGGPVDQIAIDKY